MLSGTRNKDESYVRKPTEHTTISQDRTEAYRSTVLIRNEGPAQHALDRVIHAHTRLERAERPEAHALVRALHAHRERDRAHRAHERAQLRVQRQRCVARGRIERLVLSAREQGHERRVEERADHHADHERGEDVPEGQDSAWLRGLLERGHPVEDEEVHGALKACLCEA